MVEVHHLHVFCEREEIGLESGVVMAWSTVEQDKSRILLQPVAIRSMRIAVYIDEQSDTWLDLNSHNPTVPPRSGQNKLTSRDGTVPPAQRYS